MPALALSLQCRVRGVDLNRVWKLVTASGHLLPALAGKELLDAGLECLVRCFDIEVHTDCFVLPSKRGGRYPARIISVRI